MRVRFLQRAMDVVAPRRCGICGRRLHAEDELLCCQCTMALPRTDHLSHPDDNLMAQVFWGRVRTVGRAAAFCYHYGHAESARPLYQLKYFGQPQVGVVLGRFFGQEMKERGFSEGINLIIPVPLAPLRLKQRGYNQSSMLAQGISEATDIPVKENVLLRNTFDGSQTARDRWRRNENVKDAFALGDSCLVKDKHVLLVDDVVTTGATSCACAYALEQAHPACISFASLAFVDDNR